MTPLCSLKAFLPLALALAGSGFTTAGPAAAQTTGETPAADPCPAVFADSARTNRNLVMESSQPRGSDAIPGTEIRLDGIWAPSMWDAVTALTACVEVAGDVDPNLGGMEEPPVNDGAFSHGFTVPGGLNNGTVICTRMHLAGDPTGEATSGEWISRQACFEVHPVSTDTPTTTAPPAATPTTTPPTTTPTTAVRTTPTSAPPAPPTTPTTAVSPPARPAPAPASPEPPGQSTISFEAPFEEPAVSSEAPRPRRPTVPVTLPELPRTGAPAPLGPLTVAGAAAVAAGLPLTRLRRRR